MINSCGGWKLRSSHTDFVLNKVVDCNNLFNSGSLFRIKREEKGAVWKENTVLLRRSIVITTRRKIINKQLTLKEKMGIKGPYRSYDMIR
jgi:hypothetical protein